MWSTYHWFNEYAGFELPEVQDVDLYFSPRGLEMTDEMIILTGSSKGAALIADRGLGFDFNINDDIEVSISDPKVLEWDGSSFNALTPGEATCDVNYSINGSKFTRNLKFISTPFPLLNGYFNPSIWETGTFDEKTGDISTGQYGFAGWKYGSGLDLSEYNYLICEVENPGGGLSLRLFDKDSYWTDPAMYDFNGRTRIAVDLRNMKSSENRTVDPSHLYIIGFWTYGGHHFKVKKIFPANDPNATAVESVDEENNAEGPVYNMQGIRVASTIYEVTAPGIYIINGKKILWKGGFPASPQK
ncbi:MAG: hypothetical protein K2G77_08160, partial [Muribaculaceae bacterium]|nr:hypothetical protein [Muribaculaceae bacterium]